MKCLNSLFYSLFILIISLFGSWSQRLLPYRLTCLFDNSRRIQLILLFLIIMFSFNFVQPEKSLTNIVLNTFFTFILYLVVTKQSVNSFIFMVICLIVTVMLTNSIQHYHVISKSEENIPKVNHYQQNIVQLNNYRNLLNVVTIGGLVYGVSVYFVKKYRKHYKQNDYLLLFCLKFIFEGNKNQRKESGCVF